MNDSFPSSLPLSGKTREWLSLVALVATSLVPLYGVLALGWPVYPLMLLFWAENLIVGLFNVLSILAAQPHSILLWMAKLPMVPFFCIHYGIFTLVHGIFVLVLFSGGRLDSAAPAPSLFIREFSRHNLGAPVLAILLAHAGSFVFDYLGSGEYKVAKLDQLMTRPYSRIIILHVVLLGGALLIQALHSPLPALLLLIALKLGVDLRQHRRDRLARAA